MLTIRRAQLEALDISRLSEVASRLAPDVGLPSAPAVALALRMARQHGTVSETDIRDVLAIAAELRDLDFDSRPEHEWIHARLRDAGVSSVSRRLARVAGEVLRRASLARHNREIEATLGRTLTTK